MVDKFEKDIIAEINSLYPVLAPAYFTVTVLPLFVTFMSVILKLRSSSRIVNFQSCVSSLPTTLSASGPNGPLSLPVASLLITILLLLI